MKLLILLISIWVYCIFYNLYWLFKSKSLYKKFESGKEMTIYIPEIDQMFKTAGTSYISAYDENKDGYDQRMLKDVSYLSDKKKYYSEVRKVFLISIGTFINRLKRSIFPIHLIFLPSDFITRKNLNVNPIIKFFLTIIYWFISFIAGYHLEILLNHIYLEYLQSILDKIL